MGKLDCSYGIIPLRSEKGSYEIFLVQHQAGHWAFPKGHPEEGEEPLETARRELLEETGLRIHSFLDIPPFKESYQFYFKGEKIDKTVSYFAALVEGDISLQEEEIANGAWFVLQEACEKVSFDQARNMCEQLIEMERGS